MRFLWKEFPKRIGLQNSRDITKNVINLRYYKLKILCSIQILGNMKTPTRKIPPGWFPPDNSHPENFHQRKSLPRISPTWTIPTQDNSHPENSHQDNSHPGKLPPGKLPPVWFPHRRFPPGKIFIQSITTPDNCRPANLIKWVQ